SHGRDARTDAGTCRRLGHRGHAGRGPRAHRRLSQRTRHDAPDRYAAAHRRPRARATSAIDAHARRRRRRGVARNHDAENSMTIRVLGPGTRWPDDHSIEANAVGAGVKAEFVQRFEQVTDEQWRNADGIVCGVDVPLQYRPKLEKCRMFVKPAVGFDNVDIKAWGELGIPVCNVPDYGTMEVADHAIALMLSLMKSIEFHTT